MLRQWSSQALEDRAHGIRDAATAYYEFMASAGMFVAPKGVVGKVGESAKQWLGKDYRVISNKADDIVFMSKDGLRKMRFDINATQGDLPHVHLEILKNGRWRDAIPGTHRIYPKQVGYHDESTAQ